MPFVDWRRKKKDIGFRVVDVKRKFGRTLVNFIQFKKKKERVTTITSMTLLHD